MFLRINSSDKLVYEWEVKKVNIPTEAWEIGILPWHIPLVSVVSPGIVKFLPLVQPTHDMIKDSDFLFENDEMNISVSKWLVYVDWENILLVVSASTTSPKQSEEILLKMKKELEEEIEKLKIHWSIEDIEKVLISLQKITADLKLIKLKTR